MTFYIQERAQTGATRRLSASEVAAFFNQTHIFNQLAQNIAVEKVFPKTGMTSEQLKRYLETPPAGQCERFSKLQVSRAQLLGGKMRRKVV